MSSGNIDLAIPSEIAGSPHADREAFDVACIYYPGFHPTPFMESWHGFGWSEWDITLRCGPRFSGHRQPILPEWDPFDESNPAPAASARSPGKQSPKAL